MRKRRESHKRPKKSSRKTIMSRSAIALIWPIPGLPLPKDAPEVWRCVYRFISWDIYSDYFNGGDSKIRKVRRTNDNRKNFHFSSKPVPLSSLTQP